VHLTNLPKDGEHDDVPEDMTKKEADRLMQLEMKDL